MTLRLRLLLVLVGIVAVGLLVADVFTYTSLSSYLNSQVDSQLQSAATPVARVLWVCYNDSQGPFGEGQGCLARIPTSSQIPPGTYGQLRDANGNVLYSACLPSESVASNTPVLPSSVPVSNSLSDAPVFTVTATGCEATRYRGIAVTTNIGTGSGNVAVLVAVPMTQVDQTLGRLALIEILVSLAVLGALAALVWWIVRRDLKPLEEMATTAGAIAAGDLSQRVTDTDIQTEVGKLGAALNTMLAEIEQAFVAQAASEERLRRFLADASHELRTPLTSIRGYAELFDRGVSQNPDDLATSMRHIREDANRMSLLVEDLLLLARLDHHRPVAHDPVDMVRIANAAVEAARVSAPERAISLESPDTAQLTGDADRLRQVLDNLLTNALRHTPAGTPVEVRVRTDPASVGVEVTDHGAGIPPEEHKLIFEPFHRADPSRARSSGGVGLGLAIVSAIVHAHGGRVGVVSNGSGGTTFWIQIPRHSENAPPPEHVPLYWPPATEPPTPVPAPPATQRDETPAADVASAARSGDGGSFS